METIASMIKKELAKKGWRKKDLANRTGLAESLISEYVNGKRTPGKERYQRIIDAFAEKPKEKEVKATLPNVSWDMSSCESIATVSIQFRISNLEDLQLLLITLQSFQQGR